MTMKLIQSIGLVMVLSIATPTISFAQAEFFNDGTVGAGLSYGYLTNFAPRTRGSNNISVLGLGFTANGQVDVAVAFPLGGASNDSPVFSAAFHMNRRNTRSAFGAAIGFATGGEPVSYSVNSFIYYRNATSNQQMILVPYLSISMLLDREGSQGNSSIAVGLELATAVGNNNYFTFSTHVQQVPSGSPVYGFSLGLLFHGKTGSVGGSLKPGKPLDEF